jgi:hypothetical protein
MVSVKNSSYSAEAPTSGASQERRLQTLVTAYIVTGLFFLLLPGTFFGVESGLDQ